MSLGRGLAFFSVAAACAVIAFSPIPGIALFVAFFGFIFVCIA